MQWNLPGPARWLRSLASECGDGQSGIVFCPSPRIPEDLVFELEALIRHDVHTAEGLDFGRGSPARLVQSLREWLCLPEDPSLSARQLARDTTLGRQTVIVDCRRLDLEQQAHWLDLAAEFSDACREIARATRPRLWIISGPVGEELPHTPHSDVNLRVRWWWGVMSSMDVLLAASELGIEDDLVGQVAEIARWDLELLEDLRNWDGTIESLEGLEPGLEDSRKIQEHALRSSRSQPPTTLIGEWASGMAESWHGEISPHVSAELAWRHDAIESRVWLAQVARMTPIIEMERWRLAASLDEELRRASLLEAWVGQDITSLEIGPLLKCYLDHFPESLPAGRRRLLRELRDARNDLAHRRPLSPSSISSLRNLIRADR